MHPSFCRELADQARRLVPVARNDFARAKLRLWAVEFDALAQNAERDMADYWQCSPARIVNPQSEQRRLTARRRR